MIDIPDDAFRDTPVLESVVNNAADALRTDYERRTALEALAAYHMGYSWLLVAVTHAPIAKHHAKNFDSSVQAAFIGKHNDPTDSVLPEGYRYELVDLSPLEDPDFRVQAWKELNSDHADD
jgi:hypothetical protein